jgi:hypothetical protein
MFTFTLKDVEYHVEAARAVPVGDVRRARLSVVEEAQVQLDCPDHDTCA